MIQLQHGPLCFPLPRNAFSKSDRVMQASVSLIAWSVCVSCRVALKRFGEGAAAILRAAASALPRHSSLSRPHHAPLTGGRGALSSPRPKKALFSPGPTHPKGLTMAMVNNSLDEIDLAALKVSFVPSFSIEPRKCCFCAGPCWDFRSHGGGGQWYLRTGLFSLIPL